MVSFFSDAQSTSTPGSQVQSPPLIGSTPRDVLIRQGDSVTLKCPLTSPVDEQIQFQWFRDGQLIPLQNSRNGDLAISATGSADVSGNYRCAARNSNGGSVSETTNVTVAAFGPFATVGQDYFRKTTGKNGWVVLTPPNLLAISPSGSDVVQWQWSFYDQAVSACFFCEIWIWIGFRSLHLQVFSNLTHYVTTRGELVILGVQPPNQGQYSVEAHHTLLNQRLRSPSYELVVEGKLCLLLRTTKEGLIWPRFAQCNRMRRIRVFAFRLAYLSLFVAV